ncbi:MAG: hypothetical protein MUE97_06645 [Phycisphaerales bacterium]|nr:hypothetical protein [Phycisphaerales bacterium]
MASAPVAVRSTAPGHRAALALAATAVAGSVIGQTAHAQNCISSVGPAAGVRTTLLTIPQRGGGTIS